MKRKTEQKHNIALSYSIASISLLCSFVLWTQTLVSLNPGQNQPQDGFAYTTQYDTIIGDVRIEEPEITPLAASVLHAAAPTEDGVDQLDEIAEIAEEEPDEESLFDIWELGSGYRISIPKIGINTAVSLPSRRYWDAQEWALMEEQMQIGLSAGAVAYPHSVRPGSRGNVIIAGHSSPPDARAASGGFGSLFKRLPELDEGDIISVVAGSKFVDYRVTKIEIVSPKRTEILAQQSSKAQLKLITCYPIGTTRDRWVVTAEKVSK